MASSELPPNSVQDPTVPPSASSSSGGAPPATEPASFLGEYKVYRPPRSAITNPSSSSALPDEYFEPTSEELRLAWSSQSRLVDRLTNAPLKTQAIRDREAKEKLARWPETRIRIKFPNQLMLEKKFSSSDKIKSVYAFVRNALTEQAKPNKFVLYEAPPRRELKVSDPEVKNQSLLELGLAPSSILHLSFLDDHLNGSESTPPLHPEILSKAIDLPPPPSFDDPTSSKDGKGGNRSGAKGNASSSSGDPKVPKWLKLGKK